MQIYMLHKVHKFLFWSNVSHTAKTFILKLKFNFVLLD